MRLTTGPSSIGGQQQIAKVLIGSESGLSLDRSNYLVAVRDAHGPDFVFLLRDHRRADGAWELIRRVCEVLLHGDPAADNDVPPLLDEAAQVLLAELKHP